MSKHAQSTAAPAEIPARRTTAIEALRGREWLERTLSAVVGMWRDRSHIDPVAWQRKLRAEWERNAARRVRAIRRSPKPR